MPPTSIRNGFSDITDPLFLLAAMTHIESAKLAAMRDYLLPKLLGGQVRVRDAERVGIAAA